MEFFFHRTGVEAVGGKYRVICGFLYQSMYSAGAILLGVVAYFIRDWKTLQLVASAPLFPFVIVYWLIAYIYWTI